MRSRLSRRSNAVASDMQAASGPYDAVIVEMQLGELTVGVFHLDLDRALGLARRAADFGHRVFEAVRQRDLRTRFRARHLVADGLALGVDIILDENAALSAVDVELEIDLGEDRRVHFGDRRGVDGEHCRKRISVLPGHDLQERAALLLVGLLVDERDSFTIALTDWARPL